MSITINFTVSDPDVVSAKLYESDGSSGPFSHVYTEAITPSSTSITYSSGSDTKWYYVTFVDSVGGESAPSTIVYGGGESWEDVMISLFRTATNDWSAPQRNDDLTIKRQLVLSASEVYTMAKAVMPFSCEYTFNVDAGSGNNWDIVPDPIYGCKIQILLICGCLKLNVIIQDLHSVVLPQMPLRLKMVILLLTHLLVSTVTRHFLKQMVDLAINLARRGKHIYTVILTEPIHT